MRYIKQYEIGSITALGGCAAAGLTAYTALVLGLPVTVALLPAGGALLAGYAYLQGKFGKAKLEGLFESVGLKNTKDQYPTIKEIKKDEFTETYFVKMPAGICTNDFVKVQQEIEQFLNKRICIEYVGNQIASIKTYKPLKESYLFEVVPCEKPLEVCVAHNAYGKYTINIEDMIHILIAGTPGAGKSVALRAIITALILTKKPEDVILNLIDFQRVELRIFKNCRMVESFCTTPEQFSELLEQLKEESERRLSLFEKSGVIVNIQRYNKTHPSSRLPYIVNIVDEFAALSDGNNKDALSALKIRIAQDRKLGIHYILCTQRPTKDIIDGSIKCNIPCRIALRMISKTDSETILDEVGAENLRMKGNALIKNSCLDEIQFMYLSETQAYRLVKPTFVEKKPPKEPILIEVAKYANPQRQAHHPLY